MKYHGYVIAFAAGCIFERVSKWLAEKLEERKAKRWICLACGEHYNDHSVDLFCPLRDHPRLDFSQSMKWTSRKKGKR